MKSFLLAFVMVIGVGLAQKDPHFVNGRSSIVQLFEWKWSDIANECENYLAPKGFAGIQISPPNENVIIPNRPWFERYQAVSYKLVTRSGDAEELADMIKRCNAVGVRIYPDIVINHMAGIPGNGTGGSSFDPQNKSYPEVPYGPDDFHPSNCTVDDFQDPNNVRNCELITFPDLDQSKSEVRAKIIDYLNGLIDLGVAGFRMDLAYYMTPSDLNNIYVSVKDLNTKHGFPANSRPFVYQEVADLGGQAGVNKFEYNSVASVLEFLYGTELGNAFQGNYKLKDLENWGTEWGLLKSSDAVCFIDNHDNQRNGSSAILTYKNRKPYIMVTAFMLAHPYGTTKIMSSFAFTDPNGGPPSTLNGEILSPVFSEDGLCTNGWVCEHRWKPIANMVQFRNTVAGSPITHWWSNGDQQIAFSRGNTGFVAFTLEGNIFRIFETGLPAGIYCDVISGGLENGKCTGKFVVVDILGFGSISLSPDEDGVLALHVNAKL